LIFADKQEYSSDKCVLAQADTERFFFMGNIQPTSSSNAWSTKVDSAESPKQKPVAPSMIDISPIEKVWDKFFGQDQGLKPVHPGGAKPVINLFQGDPKGDIDELRQSKGPERTNLLLDFQGKLDKLGRAELEVAQSYLTELLSDPKNDDDQLLGALLKSVNTELNSRKGFKIDPSPLPWKPLPPSYLKDHPGMVAD